MEESYAVLVGGEAMGYRFISIITLLSSPLPIHLPNGTIFESRYGHFFYSLSRPV